MESSKIIALAHEIGGEGFEDLQIEDIDELMTDKPLDVDHLIELIQMTVIQRTIIAITTKRTKNVN